MNLNIKDPEAHKLAKALQRKTGETNSRRMSAPASWKQRTKEGGTRQLDAFFRRAGIVIEPVTEEQAHAARQAYTHFGKGRHAAGLNFGDCFAYALAKVSVSRCCSRERTSEKRM